MEDELDASVAMRSKMSLTNELRMAMALFEIPVSGCTCFSTDDDGSDQATDFEWILLTLVDVR